MAAFPAFFIEVCRYRRRSNGSTLDGSGASAAGATVGAPAGAGFVSDFGRDGLAVGGLSTLGLAGVTAGAGCSCAAGGTMASTGRGGGGGAGPKGEPAGS